MFRRAEFRAPQAIDLLQSARVFAFVADRLDAKPPHDPLLTRSRAHSLSVSPLGHLLQFPEPLLSLLLASGPRRRCIGDARSGHRLIERLRPLPRALLRLHSEATTAPKHEE